MALGLSFGGGTASAAVNQVATVAPGVYFHEGDVGRKGHCNTGWIVFEDFILVVDANFPSGAEEVLPKIRAISPKPVRFVFDTHHHGDHAYGNEFWRRQGAVAVAHAGVLAEMKRFETGYYGNTPGRWEDVAKGRKDVAASRLHPPVLTFERELLLEDGMHQVELRHLGTAHTRGDGFVWLPKQRILFTGDACVNGPYNSMGDADTTAWVRTLEAARALQPKVICPGHGPMGGPEILEHQLEFITSLRSEVRKLIADGLSAQEIKAAAKLIKETLRRRDPLALYIGPFFESQVEKVHADLTRSP
jgi:glyoxylase-like metal-dependent hydrolase (beta-lactamase superfamily II)